MPIFQVPYIPTVDPVLFENADLFVPLATQQRPSKLHAQAAALPPLIMHGRHQHQKNTPNMSPSAEALLPVAGSSVVQASLSSHQVGQCACCERECEQKVQEQWLQSLLSVPGPSVIQPVLRSHQVAQHAHCKQEAQDQFLQQLAS